MPISVSRCIHVFRSSTISTSKRWIDPPSPLRQLMIGYTVTISKKNACYYQNFVPRTSLEDRRNEFIKFHPKKKLVSLLLRFQVSTVNSEIVCRTLDKNTRRGVRGRVAREQPESAITIQIAAIFRISLKAQMVDCSFVPAFVFFFFFFFLKPHPQKTHQKLNPST